MKKYAVFAFCCVVAAASGCETINAQLAAAEAGLKEQAAGGPAPAAAPQPWSGPITFKNASSVKVCDVQLDGDASVVVGEVAPGASVELPANPRAHRIWAMSCTKDGVVAGSVSKADALFAAATK